MKISLFPSPLFWDQYLSVPFKQLVIRVPGHPGLLVLPIPSLVNSGVVRVFCPLRNITFLLPFPLYVVSYDFFPAEVFSYDSLPENYHTETSTL